MDPESNASDDKLTIGDRMDRLEEIAETLEAGNVDLEAAKELRTEADEHLSTLRSELDVDGQVGELELEGTHEE
jgi:exonuclease VII small subunit